MGSKFANDLHRRLALLFCLCFCMINVAMGGETTVPGTPTANGAATVAGAPLSAMTAMNASPMPFVASTLVISEFRLRGPNGANDEFIEIYNTSSSPHTVVASPSGAGYGVAASDGILRCTIPNGTVFPGHGHFLSVNSVGYNYASYPAGNGTTATGDASYTTDIPDNVGIALFTSDLPANFTLANRLDAVGPANEANTLFKEGTGYGTLTPFSINSAWVRDTCGKQGNNATFGPCASGGVPIDTDNNVTDFYFVDTNGTSAGGGQRLGAPGPKNLSSPVITSTIAAAPIDSTQPITGPPNRLRDMTSNAANNSTFGTLEIRRRFINTTGIPVTRLRFRIIDITTFPAISVNADLRPIFSPDIGVAGINDASTCGINPTPCAITLRGTTLEVGGGGQPNGGGWNSSLSANSITLGTPLAPGNSINVRFVMGVQQKGNFRFIVSIEALP